MKKFLNLNENDILLLRKDRKKRGLNKIFEESRENASATEKDLNEILSDDIAAIDGPFCGELQSPSKKSRRQKANILFDMASKASTPAMTLKSGTVKSES